MTLSLMESAARYVARGWPCFPLRPRDKRPLTPHGFADASVDPLQVRSWWSRWPQANIGIPTGSPSTFDVLDVDGEPGRVTLAELVRLHGELPVGPQQITGGGGLHLLFVPGTLPTSARKLPGLDTRGTRLAGGPGGYIVMAPSVHPSGAVYELVGEDLALPPPPPWLLEELVGVVAPPATSTETLTAAAQRQLFPLRELVPLGADGDQYLLLRMAGIPLETVGDGERNNKLFRWGCSLRARGQEGGAILKILDLANRTLCRPPVPEDELHRIALSAARYEVSPEYREASANLDVVASTAQLNTAKARAQQERASTAATEAAQQAVLEATVASGDLDLLREMLAHEIGLKIRRVIQVSRDNAHYYLELEDDRRVLIGSTLLSQQKIAEAVVRTCAHLGFAELRAKRWPAVRQALVRLVEVQDDDEMERRGQTIRLLRDIVEIDLERLEGGRDVDSLKRQKPFIEDGVLHVSAKAIVRRLRTDGVLIPIPDMVARLREVGCTRAGSQGVVSARDGNRRTTAKYWQIPLPFLESKKEEV